MTMAPPSPAFLTLLDYQQRCRRHAAELPMKQEAVQYWSGIGFVIDGVRYVAPLDEVSEVLSPPAHTRIPGVQPWVRGLANVRGRLMTVVDLMAFMGLGSRVPERRRRLLVMDEGDLYTGMAVDEVLGMQHFDMEGWEARPEALPQVQSCIQGGYRRDDGLWPVFSLYRLLDDPRFLKVARSA